MPACVSAFEQQLQLLGQALRCQYSNRTDEPSQGLGNHSTQPKQAFHQAFLKK